MVEQPRLLEQLEGFRLPELVELVLPGQSFADYSYLLDRQNGTVHSFTSPFNTCEVKPLRIAGNDKDAAQPSRSSLCKRVR